MVLYGFTSKLFIEKKKKEKRDIYSVQPSLKSHPLWVTLYKETQIDRWIDYNREKSQYFGDRIKREMKFYEF